MADGETTWWETCPCCNGSGKLQTEKKKLKITLAPSLCEYCNGTGLVLIVRKLRRK
jgi:DnaJ-class molecular chaperone